jgi:hypothetical protein
MLPEEKTDRLFNAVYKSGMLNVYDYCAEEWKNDEETFFSCKAMADELVGEKLAKYADDKKTELSITNFGRYWMAHGGFLIYLKEGEKKIKADKDRHSEQLKEELKEARLKFTHYRIITYWWSFALSIISFLLSLLSLYLVLTKV